MMRPGTILALLIAVWLGGCAPGPGTGAGRYDDPLKVMMAREEGHRKRWAAAEQAERELAHDPQRIAALQRLVWERGHPAQWSNYAVDELIEVDEAQARDYLARVVTLIKDWETLNHVFDRAVERNWVDFVPALVRNYSLRTPVYRDADRPERKAIEKLRPGVPVEGVVLEVFASGGDSAEADIRARVAAWSLLHRLSGGREQMLALLKQMPANDSLTADLRAAADELGIVPDNLETVTWLRVIRGGAYQPFWQQSVANVNKLGERQRYGLQLRHLPVLNHLAKYDPAMFGKASAELTQDLLARLATQKHYLKGPTYDGPMENHPQVMQAWLERLVWADLATIHLMMNLMHQPHIVAAWFEQADRDVQERLTELGGLIRVADNGAAVATVYPPMIRKHNWAYYPPQKLVTDAYTALAHYHFHAQDHANAYYSGPGLGDLERTAATQQFNGLVLTFIDKNHLNVDYYQLGDVVVDLGTISRTPDQAKEARSEAFCSTSCPRIYLPRAQTDEAMPMHPTAKKSSVARLEVW